MKTNNKNSFWVVFGLFLISLFSVGTGQNVYAQNTSVSINPTPEALSRTTVQVVESISSAGNAGVIEGKKDKGQIEAPFALDNQTLLTHFNCETCLQQKEVKSTLSGKRPSNIDLPSHVAQVFPTLDTPAPVSPEENLEDSAPVGSPPSLQTEPTTPGQLPFQPKKDLLQPVTQYNPGITFLTPSAFGKSWGQITLGGSLQSRVRFRDESDGFLGAGIGFGDAKKAVGLDLSIGVADVSKFERGTIGFKLHRRLADQFAIAVGVDNALTWGNIDSGISPYGVITKGFQLRDDPDSPFSQVYVSAGAGTGRYRSEGDIVNERNTVGVFGSVAVRVIKQVNFITEWSGQDLSLGISVLPFPKIPIVITPAVTDLTGTAGNGPRFVFGMGVGFSF